MADELNFQVAAEGFGSYLDGILPADIATSAGAFSATMQQIRNILSVDFEKFSQVVYSTEVVNTGLNLVNGTDIPTNLSEAVQGHTITSLGSGPYGTYTASDFFGCMSGLPYMWADIQGGINTVETTKLYNIYHELFLAVTWERAEVDITQSIYNVEQQPYIPPTYDTDPLSPTYGNMTDPGQPRIDWWYYTVDSSLTQNGGGYGRGTAPAPTVVFSPNNCGASATCTIGTNDASAASVGGGTFGRVTSYNFNAGSAYKYATTSVNSSSAPPAPAATTEYVTIQSAPTATLAVLTNGKITTSGTNTSGTRKGTDGTTTVLEAGWPSMNSVVQAYITQANTEIAVIRTTKPYLSNILNTVYNAAGTQLKIEQRARFTGIPPVPVPRDDFINIYPTALSVFVDSVPYLAQDTRPHMYAQTLEAISNVNTVGGQSLIAMMREERNAARLQEIGIELDNNIPGEYDPELGKVLISNGTVPVAVEGIEIKGINGNKQQPTSTYTVPSSLIRPSSTGEGVVAPKPLGFYDPNTLQFKATGTTSNVGQFSPAQQLLNIQNNTVNNVNLLGPAKNGTGPAAPTRKPTSASTSTGVVPNPNSVNPNPNQIPLNFQTGTNNLGSGIGAGGGSSPRSGSVGGAGNAPSAGSTNPNGTTGSSTPANIGSGGISIPLLQRVLLGDPSAIAGELPADADIAGVDLLGGLGINLGTGPGAADLIAETLSETDPIVVINAGPQVPLGIGVPIDTGKAAVPGSLASSKAVNLIAPNLNGAYIASTLTPATLSVEEAIDDVIRCNCDCWID